MPPAGPSLTQRTKHGLLWTLGGTGATMLSRLGILMVLARLLTPADYGAVEAAMTSIIFFTIFSQLGVGPAVIQRPELTETHIRVAGTLSVLLGCLVAGIVYLCADPISHFFHRDDLQPILRVLAIVLVLQGVFTVSESQLRRDMQFKALSIIDFVSYTLGYGAIGIFAASAGYGVWSLVAAQVGQSLIRTSILLWVKPHAMRPSLRLKEARDLVGFGAGFTVASLANQLATNGDNLVVGRMLGTTALGNYGRAYQLMVSPAALFGGVVDRVLFPAMAQIQEHSERLTAAYRRCVSVVALASLPTAAVLVVLAPEAVRVAIGPNWGSAVEPFRILAAGLLFRTGYKISDSLTRATGSVYRRAWRQIVYAGAVLFGAWYGCRYDLTGVAYGVLAAITLNFLLMADLSLRVVRLSWLNFLSAHRTGALHGAIALAVSYPIAEACRAATMPAIAVLALTVGSTLAACGLACWAKPRWFLTEDGVWLMGLFLPKLDRNFAGR